MRSPFGRDHSREHRADGIGQRCDFLDAARHGLDALLVEHQPVEQRTPRAAPAARGAQVARRSRRESPCVAARIAPAAASESRVLLLGRGARQHLRGGARRPAAWPASARRASGKRRGSPSRSTSVVMAHLPASTRSSRWIISSRPRKPRIASISELCRPMMRAASASEYAQMPRAISRPSGLEHAHGVAAIESSDRLDRRPPAAGSCRRASAATAPPSTVQRTGRLQRARDPLLAHARSATPTAANHVQRAPSSIRRSGCVLATARDAHAATGGDGDARRGELGRHAAGAHVRGRRRPPSLRSRGVICSTCPMNCAPGIASPGRRVYRPSTSESSTRQSALIICATRAARRSLSP